jgi:hypothetical protein
MQRIKFITFTFSFLFASTTILQLNAQKINVIPEPSSLEIGNGQFKLPKQVTVSISPDFAAVERM